MASSTAANAAVDRTTPTILDRTPLDHALRLLSKNDVDDLASESHAVRQRHASALSRVALAAAAAAGFEVADAERLAALIRASVRAVAASEDGAAALAAPICELLALLRSRPLVRRCASDEACAPAALAALLDALAFALTTLPDRLPSAAEVLAAAAGAVEAIASAYGCRPSTAELVAAARAADSGDDGGRAGGGEDGRGAAGGGDGDVSGEWRVYRLHERIVRDCTVAPAVLSCLARVVAGGRGVGSSGGGGGDDDDVRRPDSTALECCLLQALVACSYGREACGQLLETGALPILAGLARRHGAVRALAAVDGALPLVVEAAWNLFELAPARAMAAALEADAAAPEAEAERSGSGSGGGSGGGCATAAGLLVSAFGGVFASLLRRAEHARGKELRNDACAVLNKMLGNAAAAAAAASSGVLGVLLAAACAPEAPPPATVAAAPGALAGGCALDVEMRLMLWSAVAAAAEADASGRCLELAAAPGGFLRAVASHVDPRGADPAGAGAGAGGGTGGGGGDGGGGDGCGGTPAVGSQAQWQARRSGLAPEHRSALRRAAWSALARVAPLAGAAFVGDCDGAALLVRCVQPSHQVTQQPQQQQQQQQQQQAASVGVSAGVAYGDATLAARLMAELCTPIAGRQSGDSAEAFAREGAIGDLLQLVRSAGGDSAGGCAEPARVAALRALAAVCAEGGAPCLGLFRSGRGVAVIVRELEAASRGGDEAPRAGGPPLRALAALAATRSCVLPDARARSELLARDGVDALALVLERCDRRLRAPALSALSDLLLLDAARSRPFFLEWRSPRDRAAGLPQMLLEFWIEADASPGAASSTAGWGSRLLARALAVEPTPARLAGGGGGGGGLGSSTCGGAVSGTDSNTDSNTDDDDDDDDGRAGALLDKLYACLSLAGCFENNTAAVGQSSLSPPLLPRHRAALAVAREYVRLRQGEVWMRIQAKFAAEGLRPSDEDRARIESGIARARAIAEAVRSTHAEIARDAAAQAAAGEAARFALSLSSMQGEDLEAARRAHHHPNGRIDLAKLTMRERLAAKERRDAMLARSVVVVAGAAAADGGGGGGGGAGE